MPSRLSASAAGSAGVMVAPHMRVAAAGLPKAKITKVNIYRPANFNETFNQSNMVVTIETDQAGLIGVGDGGLRDTLEQCAGKLIGRNPFDIERCWQDMYRSWFYSPGHEKIHALGALFHALPGQIGVPILITQHLPPPFMSVFARQLGAVARRPAVIAEDGMALEPDLILIAPGDAHLTIEPGSGGGVVANG